MDRVTALALAWRSARPLSKRMAEGSVPENRAGGGAVFRFTLPRTGVPPMVDATKSKEANVPEMKPAILVIED